MLSKEIKIEEIDQDLFSNYLDTKDQNDPDLIIRTAGEKRLSNFLLWQSTYSELYFSEKMWPEFSVDCLKESINSYNIRIRKFGSVIDKKQQFISK